MKILSVLLILVLSHTALAQAQKAPIFSCRAMCQLDNPGLIGARDFKNLKAVQGNDLDLIFAVLAQNCEQLRKDRDFKFSKIVSSTPGVPPNFQDNCLWITPQPE